MRYGLNALALAALLNGPSTDAASVFDDRETFLAAVGSVVSEGFESYPTYTCTYGGPSPTDVFEGSHFTVASTPTEGGTSFLCTGTAGAGPVPTEGNNALIAGSNTMDKWYLDVQVLDGPVYAVGFDLVDAAENGAALFVNENGETATIAACCRNSGSELFFGFISDTPFSRFTLINTAHGDGWAIDEMVLAASSIVDPGALLQRLLVEVAGVGPGTSLVDKITLAQTYYAVPDTQATCAMLIDFGNEVGAQRGKRITVEVADDLAANAQAIIMAIGCE